MTVLIDAQPSVLETAATLLRTFADRAPSGDRQGLHGIAERFEEAVLTAASLERPERYEFPSAE